MRYSAKWMSSIDGRILELLNEEKEFATPMDMLETGLIRGASRSYINLRCKELSEYGLLRNVGNGVYMITEAGKEYLAGELDADRLEPNHRSGTEPNSIAE